MPFFDDFNCYHCSKSGSIAIFKSKHVLRRVLGLFFMHLFDVRIEGDLRTILFITILMRTLPILRIDLLNFVGLAFLAALLLLFELPLQLLDHTSQVSCLLFELSNLFLKMGLDDMTLFGLIA